MDKDERIEQMKEKIKEVDQLIAEANAISCFDIKCCDCPFNGVQWTPCHK